MRIDTLTGTTRYKVPTDTEMEQIRKYETFIDHGQAKFRNGKLINPPEGYKRIRVHLVYDIKHCRKHKARLVADGHLTDVPVESVYAGVVSLRSLRMVSFLAELNDMQAWGADVGNAYLTSYSAERNYIVAGPEFGEQQGHVLIISKALYGLRSSGSCFWDRL